MMIRKKALKVLEMGYLNLQEYCDKNKKSLAEIEAELMHLSAQAAYCHEYILMRHGAGCGDQGHDTATKQASKTLKRVRKALGFSYP